MPQTLLLADDSVTIQRVIELTFADEDITVVAVSDGDAAIERIEADPPDIVLVDIGMPGRTGYEVAHHIKQSPRLAHIPVLLLAGAFEPVDQAKAVAAGCDGVLAKPFEPQLVIARVKELLGMDEHSATPVSTDATGMASAPPAVAPPPSAFGDPVAAAPPSAFGGPAAAAPPSAFGEPAAAAPPSAFGETAPPRPAQVAKLDSYFEKLDEAFSTLSTAAPGLAASTDAASPAPSPVADLIDWFGAPPAGASAALRDLPLVYPPAAEPELAHESVASTPSPTFEQTAAPVAEPAASPAMAAAPPVAAPPAVVAPPPAVVPPPVVASPPVVAPPPVAAPSPVATHMAAPEPAPPVPLRATEAAPPAAARHGPSASDVPPHAAALPPLADAFAAILAAEKGEPLPAIAPQWPAASSGGGALSEDAIEEVTRRVLERLSDRVVRDKVSEVVSAIAERLVREEIERIKASIQ